MQVQETLRALRRRWFIVILGMVVTSGLTWAVHERIPATYDAEGSQLLMPPAASVGIEGNPYLHLGGMAEARDVLIRRVTASESSDPILDDYPGSSYRVVADASTSGSIILVSVSGTSPELTLGLLKAALGKVPDALKSMQDELAIEDRSRISLRGVVVDSEVTIDAQAQSRLMLLAAGAGLAGTLLVAASVDGFRTRKESGIGTHPLPGRRSGRFLGAGQGGGKVPLDPQTDEGPANPLRPRTRARTGTGFR